MAVEEIMVHAQQLNPTSKAQRGLMNNIQMHYHSRLANRQILDDDMEHELPVEKSGTVTKTRTHRSY
ncbi:hypothetical protein WBJ53_26485 [Spirosoma sp. SC4-14]|uniref:hypothetical protein n=1 Tax=Spirosoma sp. SC4-14 TaxID=3128900 RepID=UPI0030CB98F1